MDAKSLHLKSALCERPAQVVVCTIKLAVQKKIWDYLGVFLKCRTFSYASAFKAHLKTHSGEKSYRGNQCDFISSQAGI